MKRSLLRVVVGVGIRSRDGPRTPKGSVGNFIYIFVGTQVSNTSDVQTSFVVYLPWFQLTNTGEFTTGFGVDSYGLSVNPTDSWYEILRRFFFVPVGPDVRDSRVPTGPGEGILTRREFWELDIRTIVFTIGVSRDFTEYPVRR